MLLVVTSTFLLYRALWGILEWQGQRSFWNDDGEGPEGKGGKRGGERGERISWVYWLCWNSPWWLLVSTQTLLAIMNMYVKGCNLPAHKLHRNESASIVITVSWCFHTVCNQDNINNVMLSSLYNSNYTANNTWSEQWWPTRQEHSYHQGEFPSHYIWLSTRWWWSLCRPLPSVYIQQCFPYQDIGMV